MASPVNHSSYGRYIDLEHYTGSAPDESGSIYLTGTAGSEKIYTNVDAYLPGLTISGSGTPASGVEVNVILDQDNFSSNSATALATQQSIKAYVDSQVGGADLDFAGDSGTGAVDLDSQTFTVAGTSLKVKTSASSQTLTIDLTDNVNISNILYVGTNLNVSGNAQLGNAASDVTTVTSQLTCSQGADFTKVTNHDAGLTSTTITGSGAATLASLHCDSVNIDGGNIDGTIIGAASAANAFFARVVVSGNVELGDATTDRVTCNGHVDSDFVPYNDSTYDLGTSAKQWAEAHIDTGYIDAVSAATLHATSNLHVLGTGSIYGNVKLGNAASDVTTVTSQLTCSQGADFTKVTNHDAGLETAGLTSSLGANFTHARFSSNLHVLGTGSIYGNVNLGNAASDVTTVTSQLTCSQGAKFTKDVQCEAGLVVDGDTELEGAVTLGNATGDDITVTGRFASDLDPKTDNAYDLGASALQWKDLYLNGVAYLDAVDTDAAATWTVKDNTTDALQFSSTGKAGILSICSNNNTEHVLMNGFAEINGTGSAGAGLIISGTTLFPETGFIVYGATTNEKLQYDGGTHRLTFTSASGGTQLSLGGDGNGEFAVDVAEGSNNANKMRASAFVTYSDERLKTDIGTMDGALDLVNSMKPVNFTWKKDGARDFGFVAQDLKRVMPQAVHGNEEGMFGVDYGRLTSVLVKAIQEQNAQIEALKKKLDLDE